MAWTPFKQRPDPPSFGTQFLRGLAGVVPSVVDAGLKAAIQGAVQNQLAKAADTRAYERKMTMREMENADRQDMLRQQQQHAQEMALRRQEAMNKRQQQQQDFMRQQRQAGEQQRFYEGRSRQAYPYLPEEATRFHGEQEQYLAPETRQAQAQAEQTMGTPAQRQAMQATIPFLQQLSGKTMGAGMAGLSGRQPGDQGLRGQELRDAVQQVEGQERLRYGDQDMPGSEQLADMLQESPVFQDPARQPAGMPEAPGFGQMAESFGQAAEERQQKAKRFIEQLGSPSMARAGREFSKAEAGVPPEERMRFMRSRGPRPTPEMLELIRERGRQARRTTQTRGRVKGAEVQQTQGAQAERERAKESMRKPLVRVGAEPPYEPKIPAYQGPGVQKVYPPAPAGISIPEWQRYIDEGMRRGLTAEQAAQKVREAKGL